MNKLLPKKFMKNIARLMTVLILLGISSSFAFALKYSAISAKPKQIKFEKLSGRVTDINGNAIPNVVVCIFGHPSIGSVTDSDGRFVVDFHSNQKFGLCIDHISYCGKNILIRPKQIKNELNVELIEDVVQIDFKNEKANPYDCEKRLEMPVPKLDFADYQEALIIMEVPEFRGGILNLLEIFKQEKYNVLNRLWASGQDLKGIFRGTFVVDKTGIINTVKLDEETSKVTQETIEEIFRRIGKWKPGIQLGKPIDFKYSFIVEF